MVQQIYYSNKGMVQQIYFGKENDGTKSATTSLKNGVDTRQYVLKTWKKKMLHIN